ncbi:hypothetical protein GS528_16400 [Rhodococcus hoagii]|nr:hypothetical protein [Prescottella equi]
MTDIIDAIDALVDEQMAGGEPIGGYDYNDPNYRTVHTAERRLARTNEDHPTDA